MDVAVGNSNNIECDSNVVQDDNSSWILKNEIVEAYGWLLKAFMKAFVRTPNIVVTDQDGAMRKAIGSKFPESKHRSESENSFFSYFTIVYSTLVKFRLCYESAIEKQMYKHERLNYQSFDSFTDTAMTSDKGCDVCIVSEENNAAPKVIDKECTSKKIEEEINLHKKIRMKGGPIDSDKPFICTIDSIGAKGYFWFYVIDKSSIGKNINEIAINGNGAMCWLGQSNFVKELTADMPKQEKLKGNSNNQNNSMVFDALVKKKVKSKLDAVLEVGQPRPRKLTSSQGDRTQVK
nr:hypothetical protein [Tanacetum cinerariifolium]